MKSYFRQVGTPRPITRPKNWLQLNPAASTFVLYLIAILALGSAYFLDSNNTGSGAFFGVAALGLVSLSIVLHISKESKESERIRDDLICAFESGDAAEMVSNNEGKIVFANSKWADIIDAGSGEAIAPLENFIGHDAAVSEEFNNVLNAALHGDADMLEFPIQLISGMAHFRLTASPLKLHSGYIHWRMEDISKQKEGEANLLYECHKLNNFMNSGNDGLFSVNQDGQFLLANESFAKWLKLEHEQLINGGYHLHDFLLEIPDSARPCDIISANSTMQRGEVKFKTAQGDIFKAAINHRIIIESDGKLSTHSSLRNLSEIDDEEDPSADNLSATRFFNIFEESPISIATMNKKGEIIEANQAFASLVGCDIKELNHKNFEELIHNRNRTEIRELIASLIDGHKMETPLELQIDAKGNQDVFAQFYAKPQIAEDGSIAAFILHMIDLTEQKALEEQFAQSQKMQAVGQLAGGVAHDFNNLLTAMIGFCDLLLMRHKPGDPSFSDIMQIKQNSNRAANLVRQLLAFSRQQTLQPRVLNLTDILTEISYLLRRLIGENIELKIIHGHDLNLIKVDQGQLEQILVNLVVNARDAMPNGGRLTIMSHNHRQIQPMRFGLEEVSSGDYVMIDVIDQGVGISKENIDRIFEPFFSTKPLGSGTGLGLATVYGIVRQFGGFILVDSAPDEGSKFSILLPKYEETEKDMIARTKKEANKEEASDLTGVGRILLVEDEDAVRTFSIRALENKGYEVIGAITGEDALVKLEELDYKVDLIISDIVMPILDGPSMIKQVKERLPDLKVIFISGYAEDRFSDKLGEDENIHFLPKPFSLKVLAAKVKDVFMS